MVIVVVKLITLIHILLVEDRVQDQVQPNIIPVLEWVMEEQEEVMVEDLVML